METMGEKRKAQRNLYWGGNESSLYMSSKHILLASAIWFFTLCVLELSHHHHWEQSQSLGVCWATSGLCEERSMRGKKNIWFIQRIFFVRGRSLHKGRWSFRWKIYTFLFNNLQKFWCIVNIIIIIITIIIIVVIIITVAIIILFFFVLNANPLQ